MAGIVATAEIDIAGSAEQVWQALTDPAQITKYMFGTQVETDWQPGSPIAWKGEYEGKPYADKGEIVDVDPHRRLEVTHFSPLSGHDDVPENYHTLTYQLDARGPKTTHVSLSQDNNADADEAEHSRKNWTIVLEGLKSVVEGA
jgi:uncharacterized protein YndB with AHSA1/START domain